VSTASNVPAGDILLETAAGADPIHCVPMDDGPSVACVSSVASFVLVLATGSSDSSDSVS
jgi:hypothetical protein